MKSSQIVFWQTISSIFLSKIPVKWSRKRIFSECCQVLSERFNESSQNSDHFGKLTAIWHLKPVAHPPRKVVPSYLSTYLKFPFYVGVLTWESNCRFLLDTMSCVHLVVLNFFLDLEALPSFPVVFYVFNSVLRMWSIFSGSYLPCPVLCLSNYCHFFILKKIFDDY